MGHDLEELLARLEVCRSDLEDLTIQCKSFLRENIEVTCVRSSIGTGGDHFVKINSAVPIKIPSRTGTISNEIRSCLDGLACTLAVRNGKTTSGVYFPVSRDRAAFEDDGRRKIKKLSQNHKDMIELLRPYKGGNNQLYKLHRLDVNRKHIRLAACGVSGPNRILGGAVAADATSTIIMDDCMINGVFMPGKVRLDPVNEILSDVDKFYKVAENIPEGMNVSLTFGLVFISPDEVKSEDIISFLEKSLFDVERIINSFVV